MVTMHEFVDEGLGHSSYLIDLGDDTAAVVDPPRFPTEHRDAARHAALTIAWTVDTHSHPDYVTGSPSLATSAGAVFVAPAASRLEVPHHPVHDGDKLDLASDVMLTAIATPGHTPDHHCYCCVTEAPTPRCSRSGSLMVGTAGRTDLCGPELTEPLAHQMYRSLRRLDHFDDDPAVYPTHGAGSFCSAPGGAARTTTLGRERTTNPFLQETDEEVFVERLTRHRRAGAAVVDVRPIAAFADGHIPGATHVELGQLPDTTIPDDPVTVMCGHGERAMTAASLLAAGGRNDVTVLDGGPDTWTSATGKALETGA